MIRLFPEEAGRLSRFNNGDITKLRGGYYTPKPIASLLALWAVRRDDALVLEPSCGDGQIVEAAAARLGPNGRIVAVELLEEEADKAARCGGQITSVIRGDFFTWFLTNSPRERFDAVLGNPPFIRYQSFPESHRDAAFAIMRREGLHPSKLTNAWLPFVVAATVALKVGARLALVLPAELLQVSYAAELREYLVRKFRRLTIVTFRQLLFSGTQQETVLLFGIREDVPAARMKWVELGGLDDVGDVERIAGANGVPADLDHGREKWTQYYLSRSELELIRSIEKNEAFATLGAMASVDVGVVTGRNEFFVLSVSEARKRGLYRQCVPIVGRSNQIAGLTLANGEWRQLRDADGKCLLLNLQTPSREKLSSQALEYVAEGERRGFHLEFKCRIRLPAWWQLPSVWAPDAFLLRQINDGPRIIENLSGATCTDTIHRVRTKDGIQARWLAAASVNSLTFAFAEIRGRSYGGGVLELEPSEAEALPFPRQRQTFPIEKIDRLVRAKRVDEALDTVDDYVLRPAGLSSNEVATLRQIWRKLYERRQARKMHVGRVKLEKPQGT